jgi:hypothetical protein
MHVPLQPIGTTGYGVCEPVQPDSLKKMAVLSNLPGGPPGIWVGVGLEEAPEEVVVEEAPEKTGVEGATEELVVGEATEELVVEEGPWKKGVEGATEELVVGEATEELVVEEAPVSEELLVTVVLEGGSLFNSTAGLPVGNPEGLLALEGGLGFPSFPELTLIAMTLEARAKVASLAIMLIIMFCTSKMVAVSFWTARIFTTNTFRLFLLNLLCESWNVEIKVYYSSC